MYSRNPLSSVYHNTTAHFNAYFIANETMTEIETTVYSEYQWNYNKILPIFPPIDSSDAKSLEPLIEDCIEKASIAIQRHEGSKWEDDSYLLVGKARYYALEYPDAIETFKYINKHSKHDASRHEALIELIKTFVDFNEINNAIAVSDYLKKEELNTRSQKELSMVRAYLYQKRKDYDQMVRHLVAAEKLMTRYSDRARIDFIIGQVYQELGFEAEAYTYYENTLRNNPSYELSFYTKLNMAQVTRLASSGDIRKTRKYFKKLLKDTKNKEYKDKIYYEMAAFELKQGNIDQAIAHYKASVQYSVKNQRQKAYSYLKLGQIYYDSLKNFEMAQSYYDSTVNTMPNDEENFARIRQRQEVLDDFVKQIVTIRTNDSLIVLSQQPRDSLIALATKVIREQEAKAEESKKREERRRANATVTAFDPNSGELIGTKLTPGAVWYFYNPAVIGKGASEFLRIWGDRPLEDNWRRGIKSGGQVVARSTETEDVAEEPVAGKEEQIEGQVNALLAEIPDSEEEIAQLLSEVEEAHYSLGNIYNFKLDEADNAISTFEKLLVRFPESDYQAEVLYQLYLLYKDVDEPMATDRARELKSRYPETIYARLIDNPNYREESQAATEQLKRVYAKAYRLYEAGEFTETSYLLDSALNKLPENTYSDNLMLLNVLAIGQLEGQYKYQYELNNFIKNYPNSELLPYAKTLVQSSEDYQINLFNSAKARFVSYFNQKHYLVVVYPNKDALSQAIPQEIDDFLKKKNFALRTGNLILNESYAMVLINEFPGRGSAVKFLEVFESEMKIDELHKGEKIYSFVITEDNFDIFYQTKDLNAYLNFFDKNYQ